MTMTSQRARQGANYRQALLALFGLLAGLSVFIAVQRFITPRYEWVTSLDMMIPFIAQTWWVYVLFFPLVLLAAAYTDTQGFKAFRNATAIAFVLAMLCFWLFPEYVPRPDISSIENTFLHQRLSRLWALDYASNGCPSLHVAVTCLACRALWRHPGRWLVCAAGLLICVSTLTLKQHTVIDVAGGVLLAASCALLTRSRAVRQGEHFHASS